MKIGIMQPYFFPYIGYFQLIQATDIYVNLDHVSFMKRSYMTRNTLKNNTPINIPVSGASQNKSCREVNIIFDEKWQNKLIVTLNQLYGKEDNFCLIMDEIISPWFEETRRLIKYADGCSISSFNIISIQYICEYLDIKTSINSTSINFTTQKREKGLQDIIKFYGAYNNTFDNPIYINAIGGQSLYTKENFAIEGIDLKFIKNKSEIGNTSILDLLFRFDKEYIKQELNNYELI